MKRYDVLNTIMCPGDVQKLNVEKLKDLSDEMRTFLIETIAQTGGHFGSNLGVVELTVALHHVFNMPKDNIVWDVGHQAYPHKILTGRKNKMHTIRQKDGLSPFPKREESKYDVFGVGHSTTSISAVVGMALADKKNNHHIAVIGDGALTGGMGFEALNHAGDVEANVLVILNDNKMSISPNVGAMHKYLTRLATSKKFQKLRSESKRILSKNVPTVHEIARRAELYAKGMIMPGTLFEELGFAYYGPIDGHDVTSLVEVLKNLKEYNGPRFLHVVTKKGEGYKHAKNDPTSLHAVSPFDPKTGEKNDTKKKERSYTNVFSDWVCAMAKIDKSLHAITPAMLEGSGLQEFHKKYPKRHHDVGIAEQHAVTFAAGLAISGVKPVIAIYSTFLQRAYDQLIHDVALQELNVLFAIDRAGIVGPDGATHAGSFDLSYLRLIPNMVVLAPADLLECEKMLQWGYEYNGVVAVRYPRGGGQEKLKRNGGEIKKGKAKILREGKKVAILAFGAMVERCVNIAENLDATLVNMRFIKPIDETLLKKLTKNHEYFVTVEDNAIMGGAGSAVNEFVFENALKILIKNIGLPDKFLSHGSRDEVLDEAGLTAEKIEKMIKILIEK
ncbi:MAG: 1-deoxy-D-xylulose-5-phosphate synthase [Candidatus Moraniibacteriota bacterium]|nr:MAG: 1-deoxy-D-xylulose-5-phosphate synthase [Candidatus Moranbacteria bacterium]